MADNELQGDKKEPAKQEQVQEETPSPTPSETLTAKEEEEALDNSKNPERTRQYIEKLKQENEDLKSKVQDNPFNFFNPNQEAQKYENLNPQQVQKIAQDDNFVNEDGEVDVDRLNKALRDANKSNYVLEQRLARVEQQAQARDEARQIRETYEAYPTLNPKSDKFDPDFYKLVRDRMISQQVEGGVPDFLGAANELNGIYNPNKSEAKIKEETVKEIRESQKARNQGPIEKGKGQKRQSTPQDELKERTRAGDDLAAAERIDAIIGEQ